MNKRGFTLIELLAVIVILAIIALIAVPIVLDIIKRDGSELGFASERIRNDKKIVGKVLEDCNRRFLHYASTQLRDDKEFILRTIERNWINFEDRTYKNV